MTEKTLQFVAEAIDGNLVVCDDGFVIESYVNGLRADYIFSEEGQLEKTEIKNLKTEFVEGKLVASIIS